MSAIYRPLPLSSVRLLRFLDDTGMKCSLYEYDIEHAPPYACLSYCWDDEGVEEPSGNRPVISMNSTPMLIRDSLYSALRHLNYFVQSKDLLFWVDAICINQEDLEERARQVRLMKILYEGAETVLSWIGLPSNEERTQQAVRLLEALVEIPIHVLDAQKQKANLEWCLQYLHQQPSFATGSKDDILLAWEALIELLKRRYWSRTWVHQEVTLPHVKFYCGRYCFSWPHLLAFNAFHTTYGGNRQVPDRFQLIVARGSSVGSPLLDLLNAYNNRQEVFVRHRVSMARLAAVVRDLRLTSCIDPRDKIFAALPHASDVDMARDESLTAIDCTKELGDVYVDLTEYLLLNGRGLEILGYICANKGDANQKNNHPSERFLPSWVPDWRIASRIRPLNSTGLLHGDYNLLYEPCPGTNIALSVSGQTLRIDGFVFDTIRCLTSTSGREEDATLPSGLRRSWAGELRASCHSLSDEAFNRTLVADAKHVTSDENNRDINVRSGCVDWDVIDQFGRDLDQRRIRQRVRLLDAIRCLCRDRRGGNTERGSLGLFPEAAVPGDRVAAFLGGNALYVVRPCIGRPGYYSCIGECFVDGMMDGEVMVLSDTQGLKANTMMLI
ncbi:hypothetical protein M409DRAFT_23071 [Zasmidium cellare ATCC 36951]|uniref:Heterokaryon incompatibility domain-containing protein n=1 Tax=Zasmidium cellare ATCC 36951 TaxID=1080233 RepID=A0A6A6CJQ6_ZASCE|nr:uncharacterized protein M409DRAFT_23071 [Zasmidium cellare ATCC 36951]KAF2166428.1 hypothetical protein M409DRAFT_23071 [Zasmidium cellare ATCC 36951]